MTASGVSLSTPAVSNPRRASPHQMLASDGITAESFSAERWGVRCSSKYNSLASCPTCNLLLKNVALTEAQEVVMMSDHDGAQLFNSMRREPSDDELLTHLERTQCDPASPGGGRGMQSSAAVISGAISSSSGGGIGVYCGAVAVLVPCVAALLGVVYGDDWYGDSADDASSKLTVALLLVGGCGAACEAVWQWRSVWQRDPLVARDAGSRSSRSS